MAHMISTASGRAEVFYVGDVPWHGLGTKVEGAATSEAAITAAGLDWTAETEDLFTARGRKAPRRAIVRSDTGDILGTVGDRYTPVQNRDAFAFLDSLTTAGELHYETAGALGRGERVWMLARVPGELCVAGTDDVTRPYLLLTNGHDGANALRCLFTGVRVVCNNTLTRATRDRTEGLYLRHVGSIHDQLDQAREVLGIATKVFAETQAEMDLMASKRIGREAAAKFFEELIPAPEKPEEQKVAARNAAESRAKLFELWDEGAGAKVPEVRHTVWTAYNAVTEYVDHVVKAKDRQKALSRDARESRLASNWFGPGAALKSKAWATAMEYAAVN